MAMTERHWPDLAGHMDGGVHVLPIRVYYEDTDFSGAVYHANYLKFCERARSDCLRLLGIRHSALTGMSFVVRRMACEFLRPARIDELLEVETRFLETGGARMEIDQRILRGRDVVCEARVTVALLDARGRPKRLPKEMAAVLNSLRPSR
jgi:acyl-CoA thioester hydrolase